MKPVVAIAALVVLGIAMMSNVAGNAPGATATDSLHRQPIVAEVELSPVADTVVARADYTAGSTYEVPPPQLDGAQPVVVAVYVEEGGSIEDGDLVASVGGRPMLALDGSIPMYRTIVPNDTGPDVEMLQRGLARTGYLAPDTVADGVFGRSTMSAVEKLYRTHGSEPIRGLSSDGRSSGPTVPRGEIAFIPGLPATVASVNARPGNTAAESVVAVLYADEELHFDTTPAIATALDTGLPVELSDPRTGFAAGSTIAAVGTAIDGVIRVQLFVPGELGEDDVGRNFKAIIHLNEATPVLNVPLGAILTGSDGTTFVYVLASDREYYRQPVAVERIDVGRAVIAAGLEPGQRVIIGWYEP